MYCVLQTVVHHPTCWHLFTELATLTSWPAAGTERQTVLSHVGCRPTFSDVFFPICRMCCPNCGERHQLCDSQYHRDECIASWGMHKYIICSVIYICTFPTNFRPQFPLAIIVVAHLLCPPPEQHQTLTPCARHGACYHCRLYYRRDESTVQYRFAATIR